MRSVWAGGGRTHTMIAPVSLLVSGFAAVQDIRKTCTPLLRLPPTGGDLWCLDLGEGACRLGGSAWEQTLSPAAVEETGGLHALEPPDIVDVQRLRQFFRVLQTLKAQGLVQAYHDRADGGLLVTLLEMAFAARCGLEITVPDTVVAEAWLFNEELGAVVQVPLAAEADFLSQLGAAGLLGCVQRVARVTESAVIDIRQAGHTLLQESRADLQQAWQETSLHLQRLRDDPDCAQEEWQRAGEEAVHDRGLQPVLQFDPEEDIAAPYIATGVRPRVAILREQGVNGQVEMAAAFDRAGFAAVDVHMTDLLNGRWPLAHFHGIVACGGFSYGDVLGAGGGWARSILFHPRLRDEFQHFFHQEDRFALGVCNGCQMLSHLQSLIPGAAHWPRFLRNRSEQFEARLSLVRIEDSPSLFLQGMAGSLLPVVVAHGEGRVAFAETGAPPAPVSRGVLRYVEGDGQVALRYPANPNGSPEGWTGFCNDDGRVTILMPHPERLFRTVQHSWHPEGWGETGPWMRIFRNARVWVG